MQMKEDQGAEAWWGWGGARGGAKQTNLGRTLDGISAWKIVIIVISQSFYNVPLVQSADVDFPKNEYADRKIFITDF
jgi:hypothetical protein